jgi:hypothetical protein
MTPEEFLAAYRDIKDTAIAKAEAAAAHKAAWERFTARGGNRKALKLIEAYQRERDDSDVLLLVRETARYAAWLNMEIGTQANLFGDDEAPAVNPVGVIQQQHAEWLAESSGYKAGIAGDPIDNNPHPIATVEYVAWRRGHGDGAESRKAADDMRPADD